VPLAADVVAQSNVLDLGRSLLEDP